LISGSSQVSFNGITDKPALVSSSAQIVGYNVFATTGSNQFDGSQAITGSLTVTGQVVAQTLNVQQVTSSIVFSSGSNIFGNDLGNTQQFTGSVSVTGSLTVNGAGTFSSAVTSNSFISDGTANEGVIRIERDTVSTNTVIGALNFTNNNGATVYGRVRGGRNSAGDGYVSLGTGVGENLYALEGGNVGIGTPSPTDKLVVSNGGANTLHFDVEFSGGASTIYSYNRSTNVYTNLQLQGLNTIFKQGSTESMRITSGGDVFINNSSGVTLNSLTNKLSISSTTYNLFDISRFSDNAFGPNFYLVKSRNGSIGGNTIVANGDNLGNINWVGANGTGFTDAASIKAEVDGDPGASDMPGRLVFSTTADGATSVTERMRITSAGNVWVGNDTNPILEIANGGSTDVLSGIRWSVGGSRDNYAGIYSATSAAYNGYISFYTRSSISTISERMRITSDGQVLIGMTSNTGAGIASVRAGLFSGQRDNSIDPVFQAWNQGTSLDNQFVHFYTEGGGGTFRGSIDFNRGAGLVRYNTSSDYRLKSEIEDFNASEIILNLKPKKYRIGDAEQKTIGFIAHELQEYYPQAVSGTKDQVNQNGDPIYQGVDYSQLTGLLVKAIQELKSENDNLKSRLEVLEQS
jgi:hypothetical protein